MEIRKKIETFRGQMALIRHEGKRFRLVVNGIKKDQFTDDFIKERFFNPYKSNSTLTEIKNNLKPVNIG